MVETLRDGRITTHVLDTAQGRPAAGLSFKLFRVEQNGRHLLSEGRTNQDGRCEAPLLSGSSLQVGTYEIVFSAGDYFRACGVLREAPAFLEDIPVRFGVTEVGASYHVPLLLAPYGYSTYRGS